MRIARLQIENFRSIQNLDMRIPQVCALVGPNNAGKSNILLAIQRVLGRDWVSVSNFDDEDVYTQDSDRDVKITLTFDPPCSFTKFKGSDPVSISTLSFKYARYKIGPKKQSRRLEQKCFDALGKSPFVPKKAPKKGQKTEFEPLVNIPQEVRESVPLIFIGTNRSLKEHLPAARYSLLRQLLEDVNKDLHDPTNVVSVAQPDGTKRELPRLDRFRDLMTETLALLRTDSFIDLEKTIKRRALEQLGFDPDVDTDKLDLFFSPFDTLEFYKALDLRVKEGDFSISATQLGEGFQNALVLAILQAFEERKKKGAIFLIEEPEMFLHPQMQRSLYRTFREIGKDNQIIYTTHSPHFVTVPEYHEARLVRKGDSGTRVQASALPTNDARRQKLIKELDPERNELFFATRLLLVEGDTEKMAFPEYAKRLKLNLDRVGASIVEVGGKRNLVEFAEIAISFGIPTGILYDKDSSDFSGKNKEKEEAEFNASLDARETKDGKVRVWSFDKRYEDHLRKATGEVKYQALCQKFPNVSKAVRARLIAMELEQPIPDPIKAILEWLASKDTPAVNPDLSEAEFPTIDVEEGFEDE